MSTANQRHDPNAQPRVGVGVFVFHSNNDHRFLLGVRKGSIGAGTYSLAGGHLEPSETFAQCAIREVKEETDLDIEDVQFVTAVESFFGPAEGGKHYVTVLMRGVVVGGEAKLMEPDKCEGWEWFSFREMREMNETRGKDLFLPLRNLFTQRPDICALLER